MYYYLLTSRLRAKFSELIFGKMLLKTEESMYFAMNQLLNWT